VDDEAVGVFGRQGLPEPLQRPFRGGWAVTFWGSNLAETDLYDDEAVEVVGIEPSPILRNLP
jgi:hypothetical protein